MDLKHHELQRRLLDHEDAETETSTADQLQRTNQLSRYLWTGQILIFLLSSTLFVKATMLLNGQQCECNSLTQTYSPALEAVAGTEFLHRFDGSFAATNRYKGAPSPALDAEWDEISYKAGGVFRLSEEGLRAVNASLEFSVELSEENGGGYMATVEVLHQLHCLDMLRKATHEDYYRNVAAPWKDGAEVLRTHLDHCIDNIRQKLMCDADTTVLTYVWVKEQPEPVPDFHVQHQCRDFNALKDWVVANQLMIPADSEIERVQGALELDRLP